MLLDTNTHGQFGLIRIRDTLLKLRAEVIDRDSANWVRVEVLDMRSGDTEFTPGSNVFTYTTPTVTPPNKILPHSQTLHIRGKPGSGSPNLDAEWSDWL